MFLADLDRPELWDPKHLPAPDDLGGCSAPLRPGLQAQLRLHGVEFVRKAALEHVALGLVKAGEGKLAVRHLQFSCQNRKEKISIPSVLRIQDV